MGKLELKFGCSKCGRYYETKADGWGLVGSYDSKDVKKEIDAICICKDKKTPKGRMRKRIR